MRYLFATLSAITALYMLRYAHEAPYGSALQVLFIFSAAAFFQQSWRILAQKY